MHCQAAIDKRGSTAARAFVLTGVPRSRRQAASQRTGTSTQVCTLDLHSRPRRLYQSIISHAGGLVRDWDRSAGTNQCFPWLVLGNIFSVAPCGIPHNTSPHEATAICCMSYTILAQAALKPDPDWIPLANLMNMHDEHLASSIRHLFIVTFDLWLVDENYHSVLMMASQHWAPRQESRFSVETVVLIGGVRPYYTVRSRYNTFIFHQKYSFNVCILWILFWPLLYLYCWLFMHYRVTMDNVITGSNYTKAIIYYNVGTKLTI